MSEQETKTQALLRRIIDENPDADWSAISAQFKREVLGGAAFGPAFGPLGYVLARYGASAVSFSQSLEQPPPPPKDPNTKQTRS
jgi:hypothetical protein